MIFNVCGVRVRLEFSFFLVLSLGLVMHFDNVLWLLLFSSLHEAGHLLTLYLLGGRAQELTLSCYGIGLKQESHFSTFKDLLFCLSGALVNLVFCLFGVQRELNFALALINLLPIYPLDGGRILRSVLQMCCSLTVTEAVLKMFSALFTVMFIVAGIYFKNISLLLISLYIIFYSVNLSRYL